MKIRVDWRAFAVSKNVFPDKTIANPPLSVYTQNIFKRGKILIPFRQTRLPTCRRKPLRYALLGIVCILLLSGCGIPSAYSNTMLLHKMESHDQPLERGIALGAGFAASDFHFLNAHACYGYCTKHTYHSGRMFQP